MILECCATITSRYGDRCSVCSKVRNTTRLDMESPHGVFLTLFICDICQREGKAIKFQISMVDSHKGVEAKKRIKRSRKLEENLAKDIGGRTQPGSGCTRLSGYKGDVRQMGGWRIEHKFTDALKQYILKLVDLARITKIAMEANELPALVVDFQRAGEAFAIIPYSQFLEMAHATDDHSRPSKRKRR